MDLTEKSIKPGEAIDITPILKDTSIPTHYSNAFFVARTTTDIVLIPLTNGRPRLTLNMSFSTLKELVKILNDKIVEVESALGYEIKSANIGPDESNAL